MLKGMARPKSNDKRNAIMNAAVRVIVSHGLGASTAAIAKEAGISNGSLFTYFQTKADLFNQLYLELKTDISSATLKGLSANDDLRTQMLHAWTNWMDYAAAHPEKRRAMAQLNVSDDITPETRAAVYKNMAPLITLMEKTRSQGAMKDAPANIAGALITSLFEATMDTVIQDPVHARSHSKTGFEAFWRVIG